MRNWTYSELQEKVNNDLDIQRDSIIGDTEMLGYANEAIDEAEAEIHKLGLADEYFLATAFIPLVASTQHADLPTNIYANKIKGLIYNNGSNVYPIRRFRKSNRFLEIEDIANASSADTPLSYLLVNNSVYDPLDPTTGRKIMFLPIPQETAAQYVRIWFIRNANRMTVAGSVLDIPEFANFVLSFMKVRCLQKEKDERFNDEVAVLTAQRKLMIDTLTEMVPDNDDVHEMDMSHYEEMS